MKQCPFLCNNQAEFEAVVNVFQKRLADMKGYKCVFANLYVDTYAGAKINEMVSYLKRMIPNIKVAGGTVEANITAGVVNLYGISLTFMVFFESEVDIIAIPWEDDKGAQRGKELLGYVRSSSYPAALQILVSGYNLPLGEFLNELSNMPQDVTTFGGVVTDGTVSKNGYVFADTKVVERGVIVILFRGKNLMVNNGYTSGWQYLGRKMKVTKLADNGTTLVELEHGMTLRDIYAKYIGLPWDNELLDECITFPICIKRHGTVLRRLARYIHDDGTMNFGADFRLGESVHMCYGNQTMVIQDSYNIQRDMKRFKPEGILAVSCWARKLLLNKDVSQELGICRHSAPTTGVYALGEFIRDGGGWIHLDNMSLNIVGMREGSIMRSIDDIMNEDSKQNTQSRGSGVLAHMIHFIKAVSEELEDYNTELRQLADTDSLTSLYNKGGLKRIILDEMNRAWDRSDPMALLVLDLDNFKGINDTHGHLVGDAALMHVAKILKGIKGTVSFPGRWGGDEFVVILRNCDVKKALTIAEKIRTDVENTSMDNGLENLTVSIGVTILRLQDDNDTFFKRADDALYSAKHDHGKNNVQLIR